MRKKKNNEKVNGERSLSTRVHAQSWHGFGIRIKSFPKAKECMLHRGTLTPSSSIFLTRHFFREMVHIFSYEWLCAFSLFFCKSYLNVTYGMGLELFTKLPNEIYF